MYNAIERFKTVQNTYYVQKIKMFHFRGGSFYENKESTVQDFSNGIGSDSIYNIDLFDNVSRERGRVWASGGCGGGSADRE